MSDWRSWCRLCASFEGTAEAESELNDVLEQIFEVKSRSISEKQNKNKIPSDSCFLAGLSQLQCLRA